MKRRIQRHLLLVTMTATAGSVFATGAEITKVAAVPYGDKVRIEVELTAPMAPKITPVARPDRLIIDFQNVAPTVRSQHLLVNKNGVKTVRVGVNQTNPLLTRVVVDLESLRPYEVETLGNKVVLRILPPPNAGRSAVGDTTQAVTPPTVPTMVRIEPPSSSQAKPENPPVALDADQSRQNSSPTIRGSFRVKYIAENTVYIDGGSNCGLQEGMNLVIRDVHALAADGDRNNAQGAFIAAVRVIGVATTSAITEVHAANRKLKVGDWADLTPQDTAIAMANVLTATANALRGTNRKLEVGDWSRLTPVDAAVTAGPAPTDTGKAPRAAFMANRRERSRAEQIETVEQGRLAGRIGLDYSGIASSGSTPGTSTQLGISFQSDMTHILGTHWNLQGYWRGRVNRHSQFQQPTIEDTLNKTYTMQLYYDNPESKWVAGFGRLYLPWAVSLDTIDGGYIGRKMASGVTTGAFAGSTPNLTSWNYEPNHRIAGSFVNFEGGGYERFHYTSTTGVALGTVNWKLDRPYFFFENEVSYKGLVSVYHSLIEDSPRGATTNGIRFGTGVSHSYLTVHFQPRRKLSFDIYHNYFRDVPTATTPIVGTGIADKLLFQGVNAGVHFQPVRHVTLYTSIGRSEKTGDSHGSLNQMYGATWSEIAHSGIRADFHYSMFDSNFGEGSYRVLSLSRQISNRMFWNLQVGNQDMFSRLTANNNSNFIANSIDINLGKHSYLQSGYTYVNGASLNYRQYYLSWGYRFDKKQKDVEFVQGPELNR